MQGRQPSYKWRVDRPATNAGHTARLRPFDYCSLLSRTKYQFNPWFYSIWFLTRAARMWSKTVLVLHFFGWISALNETNGLNKWNCYFRFTHAQIISVNRTIKEPWSNPQHCLFPKPGRTETEKKIYVFFTNRYYKFQHYVEH